MVSHIPIVDAVAKEMLIGENTGHDYHHALRVYNLGRIISGSVNADSIVVDISCYWHDLFRPYELRSGDSHYGPRALDQIRGLLKNLQVNPTTMEGIVEAIRLHEEVVSFDVDLPIEVRCLQDADRLDAIGAIGIGRVFMFGSACKRAMYTPSEDGTNLDKDSTIRYILQESMNIKNRLYTEKARELAERKHQFLVEFVDRFFEEWATATK